jgi:hypothetical protein
MEINKKIIKYSLLFFTPIILILFLFIYLKFNDPDFYIEDLSERMKVELINSGIWNDSCPVHINRLKIVNVRYHIDKNSINRNGQLITLDVVSHQVLKLFKELFRKNIFIEKINNLIEYKTHSDSLLDNNSLSFICDENDLKNGILNSYGVAFDINPLYNPILNFFPQNKKNESYIIVPTKSLAFVNRSLNHYMMNERIVSIFSDFGFNDWGGNKVYNPSFQYFSINKIITKLLLSMNKEDAEQFFKILVNSKKLMNRFDKEEFIFEIKFLYEKDSVLFLKVFKNNIKKLNKMSDSAFFDLLRKNMANK